MDSKIEQVIGEIEDFIENCKYQPFSNSKIVVDKDELDELLADLRRKTPEEIKKYQRIIRNQERILADAKTEAEKIIAQAQVHTTELISEHQIMQQAYEQANEVVVIATNQAREILSKATADANEIRWGAIEYTDNILHDLEEIIGNAMETTRARTENLLGSLQKCYEELEGNRRSMVPPQMNPSQFQDSSAAEEEAPVPEIQMPDIS